MKKRVQVDGQLIRNEREKRAWTQEKLSEESQLAVRTLRRMEAGLASLESVRRVSEVLNFDPANALVQASTAQSLQDLLRLDPLVIEFSSTLCQPEFMEDLSRSGHSIQKKISFFGIR